MLKNKNLHKIFKKEEINFEIFDENGNNLKYLNYLVFKDDPYGFIIEINNLDELVINNNELYDIEGNIYNITSVETSYSNNGICKTKITGYVND